VVVLAALVGAGLRTLRGGPAPAFSGHPSTDAPRPGPPSTDSPGSGEGRAGGEPTQVARADHASG